MLNGEGISKRDDRTFAKILGVVSKGRLRKGGPRPVLKGSCRVPTDYPTRKGISKRQPEKKVKDYQSKDPEVPLRRH